MLDAVLKAVEFILVICASGFISLTLAGLLIGLMEALEGEAKDITKSKSEDSKKK